MDNLIIPHLYRTSINYRDLYKLEIAMMKIQETKLLSILFVFSLAISLLSNATSRLSVESTEIPS